MWLPDSQVHVLLLPVDDACPTGQLAMHWAYAPAVGLTDEGRMPQGPIIDH